MLVSRYDRISIIKINIRKHASHFLDQFSTAVGVHEIKRGGPVCRQVLCHSAGRAARLAQSLRVRVHAKVCMHILAMNLPNVRLDKHTSSTMNRMHMRRYLAGVNDRVQPGDTSSATARKTPERRGKGWEQGKTGDQGRCQAKFLHSGDSSRASSTMRGDDRSE